MNRIDFLNMLDNGVDAKVVVNHCALYYENSIVEIADKECCDDCIDRYECDTIEWFKENLKKNSVPKLEDIMIKSMRCKYYKSIS